MTTLNKIATQVLNGLSGKLVDNKQIALALQERLNKEIAQFYAKDIKPGNTNRPGLR